VGKWNAEEWTLFCVFILISETIKKKILYKNLFPVPSTLLNYHRHQGKTKKKIAFYNLNHILSSETRNWSCNLKKMSFGTPKFFHGFHLELFDIIFFYNICYYKYIFIYLIFGARKLLRFAVPFIFLPGATAHN
jgi:hypothetical protein